MPKIMLTLLAILLCAEVSAQENIGMVMASRGDVRLVKAGNEVPLRQGDFVAVGDQVVSAVRSFSVIQLFDGGKLSLRPESTLYITEFSLEGADGGYALIELTRGGMKLVAGSIATSNPEGFRIKTPLSILTVTEPEASLSLCEERICEQSGLE